MSPRSSKREPQPPDPEPEAAGESLPPDPERVVVVHYECESFEETIGAPRPTAIVLRNTATEGVTRIFNDDEALLYSALLEALRTRPWQHVVTWNMGSATQFGWAALGRRAAELGITLRAPTPHLDLARWLWQKYGNDYVQQGQHGRLFELATGNNLPTQGWDAGTKDGPSAGTTAQRMRRCEVKTGAIQGLLRLEINGSLRTGLELLDRGDGVLVQPGAEGEPVESLVTLNQAAAVAAVNKRTFERLKNAGKLPKPYRRGGKGRAALWRWSELRPAIEEASHAVLPERFPRLHG